MRPIRSILAATDFSADSEEALRYAVTLARALDARLTLLHVYQLPDYFVSDASTGFTPTDARLKVLDTVRELLDAELARIGPRAGRAVTATSVEGAAADEIVRAANEGGYDLVVMGTHGRTGIKRLVLGSVAEQVVRHAECPVLTVRELAPASVEAP